MLNTLVTLSLALGASAFAAPRSSGCCSFGLTASGGQSGTIGQLDDGQNRIGGNLTAASFCISNGGITDEAGRSCILTPSVEQFQCDQGVGPTYGFSIESNGTLVSPSGSSVFYACPASETEWNLYTTPVIGQLKCVEISLAASGCGAETCSAATQTVTVTATVTIDTCGTASSTPVVATSVPYVSISSAAATSSPVVPQSSIPAVASSYTPAPESSTPVVSPITTPISVPVASSSEVSVPAIASSTPKIETSIPVESSTVVVPSTPETTPPPAETTPYPETSTVVATSIYTSSAVVSTATVLPIPESSSVYSQSSTYTPAASSTPTPQESTSTYIQPSTSLASSTPIIPLSSAAPTTFYTSTSITYPNTTSSTPIAASTSATSSSTCVPTVLTGSSTSGNYQYPHLIVPVSSSSPSTAYGTSYFGNISSTTSTLFNFDIPSSYAGKTCNLIFLLPLQSELETSSYTFSGSGEIDFLELSSAASTSTSYDTVPSTETDLGEFTVTEGSSTLVESFACPAGETVTYEMVAKGDTSLYWFEDWNPSPLGLFITYC
ncbi:ubiquitin 3 binding protein But2 C-terminal domain-containing protein [Halenospora varia]|nr:ubiquitin 3 binding protein But2 C-terminal domain-containing protein [Halenospora varia]